METIKQWENGDLFTITYTGDGDDSVIVNSQINEGLDRAILISIVTNEGFPIINEVITINQSGMREVLNARDGAFICSDGNTFNVLKNGL